MDSDKQKIIPNLWFARNADEAVNFYMSAFPDSRIVSTAKYPEEGLADFQLEFAGKTLSIDFEIHDFKFTAINAGNEFKPNPSISFFVNFDPTRDEKAKESLDELWNKLSQEGEVLMKLDKYDFSEYYGWIKDKYGVSWQLILTDPEGDPKPFIIPSLLFTQENTNHAEEAIDYYVSIFSDSKKGLTSQYPEDTGPAKAGALMYGEFLILNQWFTAMDSGVEQDFTFNPGISLMVLCKDQEEIDYYWEKLSTNPEFEQCGWLNDKYGVSWQIVPENMEELMNKPGAFQTLMNQKKIIISEYGK